MGIISDLYAFPLERAAQSDALTRQLIIAHRRLAELKSVTPLIALQQALTWMLWQKPAFWRNKKFGAAITMLTCLYSSYCKGITMVDRIQFSANIRHDRFIMFKKKNFLYTTSFSRTTKEES